MAASELSCLVWSLKSLHLWRVATHNAQVSTKLLRISIIKLPTIRSQTCAISDVLLRIILDGYHMWIQYPSITYKSAI